MIRAAIIALVGLTAGATPAAAQPGQLDPEDVVWGCDHAGYFGPTDLYDHGVLGDAIEYKGLVIMVPTAFGPMMGTRELPAGQVYEDIAPRCGDLDGDGEDEVITVISDAVRGARLAVYSQRKGPIAETPPIGQGYRWLAPAGIADFDGDGRNDVAYVETPHLGGVLRIWTLQDGALAQIASSEGFSNHRVGDDFITGGVRDCGTGPELVLPNFEWSRLMAARLDEGEIVAREIAGGTDAAAVASAVACAD